MTATAMASPATWRERPILFSGPMVRAILQGRKTQTRRVVTHRHGISFLGGRGEERDLSCWGYSFEDPADPTFGYAVLKRGLYRGECVSIPCPFGELGDRLWVKETHARVGGVEDTPERLAFRADGEDYSDWETEDGDKFRWRPSLFMSRQDSRLTLEITDVRVERLQDIGEEDARAEGVFEDEDDTDVFLAEQLGGEAAGRVAFMLLWDRINGKRAPWASNPWVWAITFRRLP